MIQRSTKETHILCEVRVNPGPIEISTGVGFFNHMLELWAFHAHLTLKLEVRGDTLVDFHHTVEDTGIVLGKELRKAIPDPQRIHRFGWAYVPLNESLGRVVIDLCGRPHLEYSATFPTPMAGEFPVELLEEFFRSFAMHSRSTLHVDLIRCRNSHHGAEVLFKALGIALRQALTPGDRIESTKGILE